MCNNGNKLQMLKNKLVVSKNLPNIRMSFQMHTINIMEALTGLSVNYNNKMWVESNGQANYHKESTC